MRYTSIHLRHLWPKERWRDIVQAILSSKVHSDSQNFLELDWRVPAPASLLGWLGASLLGWLGLKN
jgi:hypothetical protein